MITAHDHIGKAHALLEQARYLLAGGFTDGAGRDAHIVHQTGNEPKTIVARAPSLRALGVTTTGLIGRSPPSLAVVSV